MPTLTTKRRESMSSTLFGMPQQAAKPPAKPGAAKPVQKTAAKPYQAPAKKG